MPKTIRRSKNMGPLHDLLVRACPPDQNGFKSIIVLATVYLNMSPHGVYKWIKNVKIPPEHAASIVCINNEYWEKQKKLGRRVNPDELVSLDDFHPFVYL